ncbi:endonuclease domain-containing protein [Brevundimonas sp.]|uniref:endonuclease domain-containing protein n=1 Tax=Brevundimonas sp. TaxID=1871086 RepID=UPI002FC6CC4E
MHQSRDRTRRARRLRSSMTGAEVRLWEMLRDRRFEGLKFRRQAPVAGSVTDFLCPQLKLVVELDGGVHRIREVEDALRDRKLAEVGFTVLRSGNEAFLRNQNDLLGAIRLHAMSVSRHPPHPSGSA